METSSFNTKEMEREVTWSSQICSQVKERSGIIEFQAFRGNNDRYIVKELIILDLQTYVIYNFLFKPPFPFNKLNSKSKRVNKWLTRNLHHIGWSEGYTGYEEVERIMNHYCSKFTRLYTTGLEKRNWIRLYTTKDVIDVKMDKCFEFVMGDICILTKNDKHAQSHCAVKNAYRLAAFLHPCLMEGGGGTGGYKSGESEEVHHQYYSGLQRENTYQDGITEVSANIGGSV